MAVVVKGDPEMPSTAAKSFVRMIHDPNRSVQSSLKKTYNVIFKRGESHPDWIVVRCEELHVNTQGKTEQEAQKNMIEAINLVVDELGLEKEFNLNIQRKFSD
jgi:predicted RNase H-like HicB family nuclease